jgi:hypothetical protein
MLARMPALRRWQFRVPGAQELNISVLVGVRSMTSVQDTSARSRSSGYRVTYA